MKKICTLLAMIFALTCIPAMAAEGDAILGMNEEDRLSFSYCFTQGDTLYLATYAELFTYHVGDADLKEYSLDVPEDLGDGSYDVATLPFSDGEKLYALNLVTEYGESAQFTGASIAEMTLEGDDSTAFGASVDVDWSELVDYYEDNSYPVRPEIILGVPGKAIIRYYDTNSAYKTAALDLSTGAFTPIDTLDDAIAITNYRDGKVLAELYSYESEQQSARFVVYDPADESIQPLGEVAVEEFSPLLGLAYDAAADTIYCVKGGEVCPVDLASGEVGAGITDMPIESYGAVPGCIIEGGYYAFCGEGAVVRNLDMSQKAQSRLKINDTTWNDGVTASYYRFINAHGDISVVLSREYNEVDNLVESMMNRDSDVDIYVLSTSLASFDALFNRGYLMELDGSEKAAALAERMYPTLREGLSVNGHLVALPLTLNAWTLGINEKALAAIGMKLEDVPDNWPDFLDFLAGLRDVLTEESGIHLFTSGYTAFDAQNDLFTAILEDYQRYVTNTNPQMGYNSELLRGLIEKLEQLDFVAMGCLEDEEEEDEPAFGFSDYSEESVLLQTGVGCSIGNFSEYTPILMRMEPDAPAWMALDTMVAIVNPFTQNPEAALAFIDELVENEPNSVIYCLDPAMDQTIRGESNQETLNEESAELTQLRADYESASAEDKQSMEQEISEREKNLEYYENYLWEISPTELEWYRAHDDNLVIEHFNWLYSEEAGEATDLIDQYREGQLSASEMLEGIDKKVQMMLMEGN